MIYITPLQWSFPLLECMEFHHRPHWSCSPRSAPLLVKYSTWNSAWNLCAVNCSLLYSYFIWNYISKIDLDIFSCLFIIPHSLVKLNNSLFICTTANSYCTRSICSRFQFLFNYNKWHYGLDSIIWSFHQLWFTIKCRCLFFLRKNVLVRCTKINPTTIFMKK